MNNKAQLNSATKFDSKSIIVEYHDVTIFLNVETASVEPKTGFLNKLNAGDCETWRQYTEFRQLDPLLFYRGRWVRLPIHSLPRRRISPSLSSLMFLKKKKWFSDTSSLADFVLFMNYYLFLCFGFVWDRR